MPHEFEAQDADTLTTGFPQIVRANGTAFPVSGYAFDATAEEAIFFSFAATDYVNGTSLVITLQWYAVSAITGAVVWSGQVAAITADVDTTNVETDGLATAVTTTDAHLGTTAKRIHQCQITITTANTDGLANGDRLTVRVARAAANGADTMAGDAVLTYVHINA